MSSAEADLRAVDLDLQDLYLPSKWAGRRAIGIMSALEEEIMSLIWEVSASAWVSFVTL
jgi:hypothetical protein